MAIGSAGFLLPSGSAEANAKPAAKPYTLSDGGRLYLLVKPDFQRPDQIRTAQWDQLNLDQALCTGPA
jgi:hypothetical protein